MTFFQTIYTKAPSQHLIAGGGVWPEPYSFDDAVERHSFFWGKDERGELRFFDDYNRPDSPGYHNEAWYVPATFQYEGSLSWSGSYADPYSLEPMVTVSVPIYRDNQLFGVSTVDLKLSGLDKLIQTSAQSHSDGFIFIVDHNGKLLSSINNDDSYPNLSDLAAQNPLFSPIATAVNKITAKSIEQYKPVDFNENLYKKLAENSYQIDEEQAKLLARIIQQPLSIKNLLSSTTSFKVAKAPFLEQESIVAITEMPETHWKVINITPQSEITELVNEAIDQLFWPIVVISVMIIAVIYALIHIFFIKPVTSITNQLTNRSDSSNVRIETDDKGELGQIIALVNHQLEKLHQLTNELTLSQQDLELREKISQTLQEPTQFKLLLSQVLENICQYESLQLMDKAAIYLVNDQGFISNLLVKSGEFTKDIYFARYRYEGINSKDRNNNADFHIEVKNGRLIIPLTYGVQVLGILVLYPVKKDLDISRQVELLLNIGHIIALAMSNESSRLALVEEKSNAETANKAKSEFLSSMSHELRTPLNSILGFGQLLENDLETPLTDNQKENLSFIMDSGRHLLSLINEVLELSAIEAGKLSLSLEKVDLATVVNESVSLVTTTASHKQITIEVLSKEDVAVKADYTKLEQIILNLLSNAIKYNHEYGQVRVSWMTVDETYARVLVEDTGIGISEHDGKHVYDAFNRLGQEGTDIEGTGIGLVVTKDLIELMGGKIDFASEAGEGTSFWIDIPLMESEEVHTAQTTELESANQQNTRLYQSSILYVEDNPANSKLMSTFFRQWQPEIDFVLAPTATDGYQAIEQKQYDLILLDINLPDMNGKDLAEKIKLLPAYQTIPLIAVSAAAMKDEVEAASELFEAYVTKPIDFTLLASVIEEYLD
jgi:signal transduction histidine kinase